jgi:hypothetical protein
MLENLKRLSIAPNHALKGALVSLIFFAVAALLLATPWYQVPMIQQATVTFSQTFTETLPVGSQVSSLSEQGQTVYTLPSPITIQGTQNVLKPGAWTSSDFNLEIGSSLFVNSTSHGVVEIREDFAPFATVEFTLNGEPPSQEAATVPQSGPYHVIVNNFGPTPITVTSITVIEETPVTISSGETIYFTVYNMGFNTVTTTETTFAGVAPYSVLGPLPSATILVIIGGLAVLSAFIERSMNSESLRRKRKRKTHVTKTTKR